MRTIYEDATATCKRVRAIVKKNWPATKFSVKCKKYSGGSSVTVTWNDGPQSAEVDRKIKGLEGADFDGMQDLKITTGFLAMEGDEMVRVVGADYIFTNRHFSPEREAKIQQEMKAWWTPEQYSRIMACGCWKEMAESEQRLAATGKL